MGVPGLGGGSDSGGGGIGEILAKPLEKLTKLMKQGDPMTLLSQLAGGAKGGEDEG